MAIWVSYRTLRIVLLLLCADAAIKGLLLIFGGKALVMRLFPAIPESEISSLLLLTRQESGVVSLVFAFLLYWAFRDPARNVAIVYATAGGLCLAAIHAILSIYTLGAGRLHPVPLIWGHALVRLGVAALLFWLRPRKAEITLNS